MWGREGGGKGQGGRTSGSRAGIGAHEVGGYESWAWGLDRNFRGWGMKPGGVLLADFALCD